MKLDYLLDPNILILLFNDQLAEAIPDGKLGYSIITEIELLSFSRLTKEEDLIKEKLKTLHQAALTANIAKKQFSYAVNIVLKHQMQSLSLQLGNLKQLY